MISDPSVKRFSRKAPAVEYFTRQPNLRDLLSSRMALRELFQLCPLPGEFSRIDLGAVARSWRHADAVARVIEATYRGGLASLDERQSVRGMGGDIIGWELHLDEDAPPFCKRVADKAAKSVRMPKVPAHIGCGCHIYPRFRD